MIRLWFGLLIFGLALTLFLNYLMLRKLEFKRLVAHDEMTRVEREARDTAATAWDNDRGY